jgi:WD40 repeat protein
VRGFQSRRTFIGQRQQNSRIKLWDDYTGRKFRAFNIKKHVQALVFSNDDKALLSAFDDGTMTVWDVGSGNELQKNGARTAEG